MPQIPQGPILDYASPGIGRALRLVRQSIITFIPIANGVEILESLSGKTQAVVAIVFAGGAVTLLGFTIFADLQHRFFYLFLTAFYLIYLVVTAWIVIAVIQSNWRRTVLRVTPGKLLLIFKTPFNAIERHWNNEQIRFVSVVHVLDSRTLRTIYELQIEFCSDAPARLFTGHGPPELAHIADLIRRYLPGTASAAAQ